MTYPIILLTLGAVSRGALISWLFLPTITEPILPPSLKLAALLVTMIGAWFAFIFSTNSSPVRKSLKLTLFRRRTMWFIGTISSQPIIKRPLERSLSLLKTIDHGWWELLSGQGFFKLRKSLFQSWQPLQNLPLTSLIRITLSILRLIVLFLFLYYDSLYKAKHWRCLENDFIS
jgi:hypothetical protein